MGLGYRKGLECRVGIGPWERTRFRVKLRLQEKIRVWGLDWVIGKD